MNTLIRRILHLWQQRVGSNLLPLLSTIRLVGLLIAALSLWGFHHIADEVLEQETQAIDTQILLTIRQWHTPVLDQIMVFLSDLGRPTVLLIASLLLAIPLLRLRRRAETMTIALAALGAVLLNQLLKNWFARTRPELWQRIVAVKYYSFPSGHAMVSMVVYGILGYLLSVHFPRWRVLIGSLTALLIGAIGFSRLYLGVHWPTDVVAGYAAGLVWLMTCILSLEVWKHRLDRRPEPDNIRLNREPD